jgi:hypothetical protein
MCAVDYANSPGDVEVMTRALVLLLGLLAAGRQGGTRELPRLAQVSEERAVAAVGGRITLRDSGVPVGGVQVALLAAAYSADGERQARYVSSGVSDENGDYRIRVPAAGRYSLQTSAVALTGDIYVPLRYDSTIEVGVGSELQNLDMAVARGRSVSVSGKFIDGLGHRYPHWDWVWLVARDTRANISSTAPAFGDRKARYENKQGFEIHNVLPGFYYLCSDRFDDVEYRAQSVIPIDIQESDVVMDIVSDAGYPVTGRIRFEGGRFALNVRSAAEDPKAQRFQILVRSLNAESPLLIPGASIHPDGSFAFLPLPAGSFRVSVLGIPAPFYLKSVQRGRADVLERGIELPPATADSLVVVVANNGAEISGRARAHTTVALIPDQAGLLRPDRYKRAAVGDDGRYAIAGIAPGRYRVYALAELPEGAEFNPLFWQAAGKSGILVEVAAGTSSVVDLD